MGCEGHGSASYEPLFLARVTPLGQDPQENEHVGDRNWGGCCMFIEVEFEEPEGSQIRDTVSVTLRC